MQQLLTSLHLKQISEKFQGKSEASKRGKGTRVMVCEIKCVAMVPFDEILIGFWMS